MSNIPDLSLKSEQIRRITDQGTLLLALQERIALATADLARISDLLCKTQQKVAQHEALLAVLEEAITSIRSGPSKNALRPDDAYRRRHA